MRKNFKLVFLIMISAAILLSGCNGQATPAATQAPANSAPATTVQPQEQPESLAYPYPGAAQLAEQANPYPQPAGGEAQATGSAVDTLLSTLQGAGLAAAAGGDVSQSFFSVPGKVLLLNGDELQVYEYAAAEAAEADAGSVSADGSKVGTAMVEWISTPHYFRSGNLILIYVGENSTILQTLQSMYGAQFAGG
jgi:hypothetical protein